MFASQKKKKKKKAKSEASGSNPDLECADTSGDEVSASSSGLSAEERAEAERRCGGW